MDATGPQAAPSWPPFLATQSRASTKQWPEDANSKDAAHLKQQIPIPKGSAPIAGSAQTMQHQLKKDRNLLQPLLADDGIRLRCDARGNIHCKGHEAHWKPSQKCSCLPTPSPVTGYSCCAAIFTSMQENESIRLPCDPGHLSNSLQAMSFAKGCRMLCK